MIDLSSVREQWLTQQPIYKELAEQVHARLDITLRRRGIMARITHREKDAASFVKKAIRKGYADPIARTTDKAGVRVVVFFMRQLGLVGDVIRELFRVKRVENKLEQLRINKVGYLSVHYDVQLRATRDPNVQHLLRRPCEIQVRTLCQDVYAEMSHALAYKTELKMPPGLLRQVHSMSALLEVADREFETIDLSAQELPGAGVYRVRATLESLYYQFAAVYFDSELTEIVLQTVLPIAPITDRDELCASIEQFVKDEHARIQHVFDIYTGVDGPVFLTQPEALLLFYMLEWDRYRLAKAWTKRLPPEELERLATAWGRPLDVV